MNVNPLVGSNIYLSIYLSIYLLNVCVCVVCVCVCVNDRLNVDYKLLQTRTTETPDLGLRN